MLSSGTMTVEFVHLLLLIIIANASPVLAQMLLGEKLNSPVDWNAKLSDNNPLFGSSKTWRGICAALLMTVMAAVVLSYSFKTGLLIASYAVFGDLLSSFIKRRFALPPSSRALLLDQVPESFFPAFMMRNVFNVDTPSLTLLVFFFIVIDTMTTYFLVRWRRFRKSY